MPSFMAFFKRKEKAPAEVQRLDWKLLERGAVALYYKSAVLSGDVGWSATRTPGPPAKRPSGQQRPTSTPRYSGR
jgi:hypothetical protein